MAAQPRTTPPASLLPKEHGAFAQLGVALAAALALAPALASACQATLIAALFLASEPALVLLGRRGEPQRQAWTRPALGRLALLGGLGALTALGAWWGAPASHAAALVPPAVLGLVLFGLFLAKRERTGLGEVVAAWAFAAATPAVVLLGGGGPRRAALLAALLAAMFTLGTAVVHGHLIALRKGSTAAPRLAALLFGLGLTLGAWALGSHALLPAHAFTALVPMTLAALGIWAFPPAPRQLKNVGWAAAACALAGAACAVLTLR